MKHLVIILIILTGINSAVAQTEVRGTVAEAASGEVIPGVNVMVKNQKGRLLGLAASNEDGWFSIKVNGSADSLSVSATMLGYKPYSARLDNPGSPITILMEEGALELQEVVVKADRIRENGDTVTYDVGSFAQKQDRTIGDVLKRMPGIDVSDNGRIQYQGTDINRFYIEGSDLLGGKYGIATNGISHEDIGAVEVMERHQPMQVLRGLSFSDQAAINLKMKNSAKATMLVHGNVGGGWSEQPNGALWQADIFTMMVTGSYQMITTLKGNNTGLNLSDQLTDFTSASNDEVIQGYVSLSHPVTPNLYANRRHLNRSWTVSSSHLLKTGRGNELKAQVDYYNDRVTARGASSTTYFLEDGDRVILEDRNALSHRNAVTGKLTYEANEKTYFLNNTLSADFSWNDLTISTSGTLNNVQAARMPEYSVSNLLKVIKRFGGNKLVTFNSRNEWNSLPEKLTVEHDGHEYGQKIGQYAFYTDERASMGFVLSRVLLSLEAGVSGYFRHLETDLWGIRMEGLDLGERLTTDYLRVFASPKFEWNYRMMELTLTVPVNLYTYFFSEGLSNRTETFLSPSLAARFLLTPRMSLTLRGNLRRSPASLHGIHDASILTDYRSFSSGTDDYYSSSGHSVSATYSFRNARSGIFVTAMGSYAWNKSKYGAVQNVVGDYIFHSFQRHPSDSRTATAYINLSKTLDFIRGAVGVRGNYRQTEKSLLSKGLPTDYTNQAFSLSPFLNGNISRYLNWNLRFTWDRSALRISEMPDRHTDGFIYSGSLTLTPCRLITWTTGGEFYHNQIEKGRYKDMLMLDSKITFNISRRVDISASVTNLLNRKEYGYTTYGTLSQFERSSQLRGREFIVSIYLKK